MVFGALAVYGFFQRWSAVLVWAAVVGLCLTAAFTVFAPQKLALLNKLWFQFGLLLGRIVSPLVLGVIFFGILTPVSLFTRLFGRDELRLKRSAGNSYWILRAPPGPAKDSFKNQF